MLDHLNRSKDEKDHAEHAHRKMKRLHDLHTHCNKNIDNSAPIAEEPDASVDQLDLGLSPLKPGENQECVLADMWEHIVKQRLRPGESADDAEMDFEQFRAW